MRRGLKQSNAVELCCLFTRDGLNEFPDEKGIET